MYVAVQVTMIRVTGGLIAAQQGGNSHTLLYVDSSKGTGASRVNSTQHDPPTEAAMRQRRLATLGRASTLDNGNR